jgi:acetyl esterase/lipase
MSDLPIKDYALWDDKPPASSPETTFRPWLERYTLDGDTPRGAVLICPGGGYSMRAPHEAEPVAQAYNDAGYHAFVVQYRVAPHRHPEPLLDAARAIQIIRTRASEWHVDPGHVAVCGFSAGGHLTASLGVHYDLDTLYENGLPDTPPCKPDALILGYPVISAGASRHASSFNNLLGPDPSTADLDLMSLDKQVTDETPPTFLWHTADDPVVPVENSLQFAMALRRHSVPFELHVYPHGRHGLGLAPEDPHLATWMALSCEWLAGMGWA